MPAGRQHAQGTTTRIHYIKCVSCVVFGACILSLLYAQLETSSHSYQSSITVQRNVMYMNINNTRSRSLFSTRTPSFSPSNTRETTSQSATRENPPPAGNSTNISLSLVATKYPPIDLEKEIPPVDKIFKRTVIVTAVSSTHFTEVQAMVGSVQRVMPNTRIVIYNLGLGPKQVQSLSSLCNVEVRRFKFSKYPDHVKDLLNYAWKPLIIKETLYEFGAVFWADSSVRFKESIRLLTRHLETFHGFIPRVANYAKGGKFSVPALTHPTMFDYLKIDMKTYTRDDGFTPKPQGGILYFVNSSYINDKLMQPWVDCAMVLKCIAPNGSQNPHKQLMTGYHVHRYDQSALALLMYKNLRGLYHLGHDATKTFDFVMTVKNRGRSQIKTIKIKRCPGGKM